LLQIAQHEAERNADSNDDDSKRNDTSEVDP